MLEVEARLVKDSHNSSKPPSSAFEEASIAASIERAQTRRSTVAVHDGLSHPRRRGHFLYHPLLPRHPMQTNLC
ncbi:MAG: hypothetical protein ACT4QB_08180 [Gammaproteobacteria bacterium]